MGEKNTIVLSRSENLPSGSDEKFHFQSSHPPHHGLLEEKTLLTYDESPVNKTRLQEKWLFHNLI